jgi:hypothetical protein
LIRVAKEHKCVGRKNMIGSYITPNRNSLR